MTDAELTILSILSEGSRYGYEIQQIIDERGLRDWVTIGFSSIYYILTKLEQQKMCTSIEQPGKRDPARKTYQITDGGLGVLQTAVSELLRQPRLLSSGFELGLANLTALKPIQVYRTLSSYRLEMTQRFYAVERSWKQYQEAEQEIPDHIRALYTHSIMMMRAELDWLESFLESWVQRYPGVKEGDPGKIEENPHTAMTMMSRRTAGSDPAKMLQLLRRPANINYPYPDENPKEESSAGETLVNKPTDHINRDSDSSDVAPAAP